MHPVRCNHTINRKYMNRANGILKAFIMLCKEITHKIRRVKFVFIGSESQVNMCPDFCNSRLQPKFTGSNSNLFSMDPGICDETNITINTKIRQLQVTIRSKTNAKLSRKWSEVTKCIGVQSTIFKTHCYHLE